MIIDNKTTIQDVINELDINYMPFKEQIKIIRQVLEIVHKYVGQDIKVSLKSKFELTDNIMVLKRCEDIIIYKLKGG